MKIYAVLNGQTDLDVEGRLQGSSDLPLNDHGQAQSHDIAKDLQSKGVEMIMAATQKRTMETAEIIAGHLGIDGSKIVKGMKLHERDFGDYEGQSKDEVDMFVLSSFTGHAATPNGETIRETACRVITYLNNMLKIFRGKTILLVVPDQVLTVLFWYFKGLPVVGNEHSVEVKNGVIYEFETDDIPEEMKDNQTITEKINPSGGDGANNAERVLSQDEIDMLINKIKEK